MVCMSKIIVGAPRSCTIYGPIEMAYPCISAIASLRQKKPRMLCRRRSWNRWFGGRPWPRAVFHILLIPSDVPMFAHVIILYLVGGLVAMNFIFPSIQKNHHPNWRTHIFQRGGPGPPTRYSFYFSHFSLHFLFHSFGPRQPRMI